MTSVPQRSQARPRKRKTTSMRTYWHITTGSVPREAHPALMPCCFPFFKEAQVPLRRGDTPI